MLDNITQSHKDYFSFLLTSSIPNHFDYRAGASLLFLFPYYIQLGLAQVYSTLESNIVEDFQLTQSTNLISSIELMQLTYRLLKRKLPPTTNSILQPRLDIDKYNLMFGYKIDSSVFFRKQISQSNSVGLLGQSTLFSTQDEILPRERLERFFNQVDFKMDNLDKYIDIAVNNNRIEAAAIFCQYFNYPTYLIQQIISKVEIWNLNN